MYKLFQGPSQVRKRFMLHDNVDDLVILIYCVLIPKSSTPHIVEVHILRYVHSYIYLIRLFQKVPRGQAVVEPPFKVRLFPSLKIANARMEKKYIHGPMQGSKLHIQSRFKKASSSSENFSSLIWVALLYSLLQFWTNLMRICLASLIQVNSGLQYLVY